MLLLLVGIAPVDDTALETIMAGIWIRSRRMNVLIATSGNSVDVVIESGFASLNWVRVLGYLLEGAVEMMLKCWKSDDFVQAKAE
jgi:hypothetical protein